MRPRRRDHVGQCEAVELTRHLDIGEQQNDVRVSRLQQIKRSVTVVGIQYLKACLFEDILGVHANDEVVIHDESVRGV